MTSAIEHSSVLAAAAAYGRALAVPVDGQGHLDLDRWRDALGDRRDRARLPAGGQPRGRHPPAVPGRRRGLPGGRRAAGAGRDGGARSPRPELARLRVVGADRGRSGVRRPGIGRDPGDPARNALAGAVPGRRLPGRPLAGAAGRAGDRRRERGARDLAGRPRARSPPVSTSSSTGCGVGIAERVADVDVVGDPVARAPAPADLLGALRRRRDPHAGAGPGRFRRRQRVGLQREQRDPVARPRGDGRAHPRQHPDRTDPDHHRRRGRRPARRPVPDRRRDPDRRWAHRDRGRT